MTPEEYCVARAAPAGSRLYYAFLFHAAHERRALSACFAFLEEVRRDVASCIDPTPIGRRLLWWQEELGEARMDESLHPVIVELRALPVSRVAIRSALEPCVLSTLKELAGWRPEAETDWQSQCHALNAGVWQLGARTCDATLDAANLERIAALAAASGQVEQILELAPRTIAGRCPLPRTLMDHRGLNAAQGPELLSDPRLLAAVTEKVTNLHAELMRRASPHTEAFQSLPLYCRVLQRINLALCQRVLRHPEQLRAERVALMPLRKLWIAWRERR